MKHKIKTATITNMVVNILLVFLNLTVGLLFGSISLISKGLESIYDVITAIVIHFTVKFNDKDPDDCHQFGHTRAENIAGYTIGILMILLSFKIIEISINKILNPTPITYSNLLLIATIITIVVKLCLYIYIKLILKEHYSPALKANMVDHLNDIILMIGVLIAVIAIKFGYYIIDPIIGIIISLLIIKSGYEIIIENIGHLMGKKADDKLIKKIKNIAENTNQVKGTNTIKTQYLGNKIQAEIHIEVDGKMSTKKSHDIGKAVEKAIEKLNEIEDCIIHIDPV